jgi:hypothetical protein
MPEPSTPRFVSLSFGFFDGNGFLVKFAQLGELTPLCVAAK